MRFGYNIAMRTIVITSFHTLVSRNILATPVLTKLKSQKDLRIVLAVPDFKVDYFRSNFSDENVVVYGAEQYRSSRYFWGLFFKRLGMLLYDNETIRNKLAYKYYWDKKFFYFIFARVMGLIGNSFWVRRVVRWLDLKLSPTNLFKDLFDMYKPDLVFSTDIQNENDVALSQDARRRGVPVVGMIRSWDNTTMRILRFWPEKLIVGSRALCEEALRYYGFPQEKIIITGNPHYDDYLSGPKKSREEFFRELGFDPAKKLIFYAPAGSLLIKNNDMDQYVIEVLGATGHQVLVRFPLGGDVPMTNYHKPANVAFDYPGARFGAGKELELRKEDEERLINELYWSDIVVSGPTSILLDAMLLDKPAIGSDIYATDRHKFQKCWGFLNLHIKNLFATGGVRHTKTKAEFLATLDDYLAHPEKDKRGRALARDKWFSHADGRAAERLAEILLRAI
jgi:hypothetical protein